MPKVVNSWNEWDPLKRVIVGRPEGTNVPAPEPAWWHDFPQGGYPLCSYGPFPQEMVDAANEQMNYFVSVLEKHDVKVDRIEVEPFMFNKSVSTPDWTQLNSFGVNNVRDVTLIVGNYIVEDACSRRSRWFEFINFKPLFDQYFKEDPEVIHFAAPKPRLTDESFVKNYYYYFNNVWTDEEKREKLYNWEFQLTEKEPIWAAADILRFGKDLFVYASSVTNKTGFDWLKRTFGNLGFRVHAVQCNSPTDPGRPNNYHPWHIDANLLPVNPGLCIYNPDWEPINPEFWELFKKNGWELIPAVRPEYVHKNKICLCGYFDSTAWISVNTFSINPKTVCVEEKEKGLCEQLDKLGIEVVPIPYEKVVPFGGALHCTTLDVYREGNLEDYFPNQISTY